MLNLGTFLGWQVGDIIVTALLITAILVPMRVTRNWSEERHAKWMPPRKER